MVHLQEQTERERLLEAFDEGERHGRAGRYDARRWADLDAFIAYEAGQKASVAAQRCDAAVVG